MSRGEGKKAERKKNYWARLVSLLDEYSRILIVTADNVGSNQMQKIRRAMRGQAVLLMGKNTMIRKAIRDHLTKTPLLEGILPHIKGNIGLVFTNGDLADVRTKLTELKIQAAAKAGSIAPIEVVVPAGNTNMEPTKTSFFQALSIPTKINRGTIEIINDIHLLTVGQKVSLSQAALLQMLGIKPFLYGLKVATVYDNGAVYPAAVLDLTDDDIIKKFFRGVSNVAALSLQIGYPTVVSVPHSVANAYKNLLAISVATDYTFPGSEKIKQLLSDPAAFAAAQAAVQASTPPPAAAAPSGGGAAPVVDKKPDKKDKDEEEVDEDMGGLFGGEDEEEGY
jgi:large subunit ribosomal protein LP0